MNEFQTIFSFFYAVYFAVTSNITGRLHPFDTPSMWEAMPKARLRGFVSVMVLNIVPLCYYITVINKLAGYKCYPITFRYLIVLFFLSLFGQGLYRFYYGLMLIKDKDEYFFYDKSLYLCINEPSKRFEGLPFSFREDLDRRPKTHLNKWAHIYPGLIWMLITVGILYLFT